MANKKFVVKLSDEERERLREVISRGKAKAKSILKARILLKADQDWADEEICRALDTNITHLRWQAPGSAHRTGLLQTAGRPRSLDDPPLVRTCRRTQNSRERPLQYGRPGAKKNDIKPHLKEYWVIPPKANAAFVAAMEDVLEVYTRPHDPARPLVCLDETSKQLDAETRTPLPARASRGARR